MYNGLDNGVDNGVYSTEEWTKLRNGTLSQIEACRLATIAATQVILLAVCCFGVSRAPAAGGGLSMQQLRHYIT